MLKKLTFEKLLYALFIGLLAYMPFHLFASRWLSLYTGGLGIWDAGKDIMTVLGLLIALWLTLSKKLFKDNWICFFILLSFIYGALHLSLLYFYKDSLDMRSAIVATLYNGRILAYFFIGLVVARTNTVNMQKILKIVLVVSTITCIFAIAQYILPKDLMTHFGYSIERGAKPAFFIDDKPDFPRVMSTVRDPNSYGAYLILPILILILGVLKKRSKLIKIALGLHLLALLLTFSRGAWLGTILGVAVLISLVYGKSIIMLLKKHAAISLIALLIAGIGVGMASQTYIFSNVILHSDKSTVMADPNELRIQLQADAIEGITDHPLGHGPGTAGLASIGNPKGTVLTENYYLQIGYEVGILGLAVFLILLGMIAIKLARNNSMHSKVLFAGFIGLAFIATLIHLWSNEVVAYTWWGLAGLILGNIKVMDKKPRSENAEPRIN